MDTLLLTVAEVFEFTGGLLLVEPEFDHPTPWGQVEVVLRRPDGTESVAAATITLPFDNRRPYTPPGKVCLFRGLDKAAVPVGTEIHLASFAQDASGNPELANRRPT